MPSTLRHNRDWLNNLDHALAEARTLAQVLSIRDEAKAAYEHARTRGLGLAAENLAAEVKLRAERKAGKILAQLKLRGGDRKCKGGDNRQRLQDLGITRRQSMNWQQVGQVPIAVLRGYITWATSKGRLATTSGLIDFAITQRTDRARTNGLPRANETQMDSADTDSLAPNQHRTTPQRADSDVDTGDDLVHQLDMLLDLGQRLRGSNHNEYDATDVKGFLYFAQQLAETLARRCLKDHE